MNVEDFTKPRRADAMFRLVLELYLVLNQLRERIAEQAAILLEDDTDSRRLMTMPGIGPANAPTILAEAAPRLLDCF